ncbi:Helix-turn-helix [Pilibacter termitis]|jgi:predicted transcriptional regulator|uniref:Helix-turn-helix n=1 Tax=Pilibacter termitis TaxID=263852 RepID=A0A1T4QZJ7_9ENTE|nr:helix-turn-helix transcriptional regulator [Pilibacter termitis]SKA09170.1 Helix-turn-helix [Pilibacter termitis]
MSEITDLIQKYSEKDPEFAKEYAKEKERLATAVAVMKLREEMGLTQRQLAEKLGKPQSTIGRIETGVTDVKFSTLAEIAFALGKEVKVEFV